MKRLVTGLILITVILTPVLLLLSSCHFANPTKIGLGGTAWAAVSINGIPTIAGSYLSLYLWSDGSLFGNTGINTYDTKWTAEGNHFKFGSDPNSGGVTDLGGPQNFEQQEDTYLKGLQAASTFKINGDHLLLYDAAGTERIVFDRIPTHKVNAADLANTAWRLEMVNSQKVTDNSSARLAIYGNGIAYGQAGPILTRQEYITENNLIRTKDGAGMRVGPFDQEGGVAAVGLNAFADGTYDISGDTLYAFSSRGTTATFKKFRSTYPLKDAPALNTGSGGASWAIIPDDMAEVIAYSDLIVMGTGLSFIGMERFPGSGGIAQYSWKSAFRVDAVFKGDNPSEIVLGNTVFQGPDGSFQTFRPDPPVQPGERWLLLLRRSDDGTYHEFGPWGRYKIVGEKVYSMNQVTGNNNDYFVEKLDINGEDLWTFIGRGVVNTLRTSMLTFYEQRQGLPTHVFDVHSAGLAGTLDVKLATGWSTSRNITFTIRRIDGEDSDVELPMPAGLRIWIDPPTLPVEPNREYRLTLHCETPVELPVGIYWMVVDARMGDIIVASRGVTLSIHQP